MQANPFTVDQEEFALAQQYNAWFNPKISRRIPNQYQPVEDVELQQAQLQQASNHIQNAQQIIQYIVSDHLEQPLLDLKEQLDHSLLQIQELQGQLGELTGA